MDRAWGGTCDGANSETSRRLGPAVPIGERGVWWGPLVTVRSEATKPDGCNLTTEGRVADRV